MAKKITPELIKEQAEALHGIRLTPQRSTELAQEVEKINSGVRGVAEGILTFDDEPGAFARFLSALKG
ncbi:MAG: hypothetical protein IT557_06470 [Alphaproteobacteria bacterium]|nr:hypothetical protein [Alphaproteobacteria bacterium]